MVRPKLDLTALKRDSFTAPLRFVKLTPRIRQEIVDAYRRGAEGNGGDVLDSHSAMNRLKLAVALAIICGLYDSGVGSSAEAWYRSGISISDEIWEISGLLMVHIRRVRGGIIAYLDYLRDKGALDDGRVKALSETGKTITLNSLEAEKTAAEVAVIAAVQGAPEKQRTVRYLAGTPLRHRHRYRDRLQVNALLTDMVAAGYITVVEGTIGGPQATTVIGLGATRHPRIPPDGTGA
jgi:hypothetical protein